MRLSLVPAYSQCAAPNRTHGPPLAFPSCNPPAQASSFITIGSPDANGAPVNSVGFISMVGVFGAPGPPDDGDILFKAEITDVRCKAATSACGNANTAGGSDYTGELRSNLVLRVSDHWNAAMAGGGVDPATTTDIPFPVTIPCANTAMASVGGLCSVNTGLNTLIPAAIDNMAGKRTVVEFAQIQVVDGGADGSVSTNPNTPFAVQGVFIP